MIANSYRALIVIFLSVIHLTAYSQFDHFSWVVNKDGYTRNEQSTLDQGGNIIVTGIFSGTVDFDPGPKRYELTSFGHSDCFIQKINSSGELIWAKSFNCPATIEIISLTTDTENNLLLTGTFHGFADLDPGDTEYIPTADEATFVLKLTYAGEFIWAKYFASNAPQFSTHIITDKTNNIYVAGNQYGSFNPDPGTTLHLFHEEDGRHSYLIKMAPDGQFIWGRQMAGDRGQKSKVALDASENVYFCSHFSDSTVVDGNVLYAKGALDICIEKLDHDGNHLWVKQLGGKRFDQVNVVKTDASNNLFLGGTFQDTLDIDPGPGIYELHAAGYGTSSFVIKLTQSGQFQTGRLFGDTNPAILSSLEFDETHTLYAFGYFYNEINFDLQNGGSLKFKSDGISDNYVVILDTLLHLTHAYTYGGNNEDKAISLHIEDHQNMYLHANTYSDMLFETTNGNYYLPATGGRYVLKLGDTFGNDWHDLFTIQAYPNPTKGVLTIKQSPLSETGVTLNNLNIEVYDLRGVKISYQLSSLPYTMVDISEQPEGMYWVVVTVGNKVYRSKVLKID